VYIHEPCDSVDFHNYIATIVTKLWADNSCKKGRQPKDIYIYVKGETTQVYIFMYRVFQKINYCKLVKHV